MSNASQEYSLRVETLAAQERITVLEAIERINEECGIGPEDTKKMLTKTLMERLESECKKNRMLLTI